MKKKLKYQLNYEEWLAIKEKQDEILFKWKEANSQENKNIELINGKINEEYEQIKKENFIKWLKKKQENQLKKQVNERKKLDEEMKKKEEKEQDKQRKMEEWYKHQVVRIEIEDKMKKEKQLYLKELSMKNQQVKNDKKLKSTIEFKNWLKKKEKEEVSKKSTYNNNNENATKNNTNLPE